MPKVVTATDLRGKIREVIQTAQFQGDHVIVTVFDKPAVAIIGIDDYRDYAAYREKQRDQAGERWGRLRRLLANSAELDELTDDDMLELIEQARAARNGTRSKGGDGQPSP